MPSLLSASNAGGSHVTSSLGLTASTSSTLVNPDGSYFANDADGGELHKQLEAIGSELAREHRIKEGAENLLNMRLTDPQRAQVVSELKITMDKISHLTERMDALRARKRKKNTEGSQSFGEDFRTSLQNATNCIKQLETLARPGSSSQVQASSPPPSSKINNQPPPSLDLNAQRIDALAKLIDILRRSLRVRYELNFNDILRAVLPCFADKSSKQCRAAGYRVIRHSLIGMDSVKRLGTSLDWYIVKSLLRDQKHAVEKEQAIKLIRTIIEFGTPKQSLDSREEPVSIPLSEAVIRALISVAEHADDSLRLICIQTLAEILIIDINVSTRTGSTRFLLHVLGEGPIEMTPLLASVFLHLLDSPRTRSYFNVGTDIEMALSAITDAYGKGTDHAERMKACANVVRLMLRTWSGLMYLCMDGMRAIRSLIDTLRIPSLETREVILDLFFDLLNIKTSAWYQTFIDGRRLTMYRKSREVPVEQYREEDIPPKPSPTFKLTDQYLALLVAVLTHAGLCEALTAMIEESTTGSNLSRKATLLMAEVLAMANRVLPLNLAAKIQAIPDVFCMAIDYKNGEQRIMGTSALSAIDSFNRNRARLEPNIPIKPFRQRANSVEDAVRRGQRQVEQVKLKMGMSIDDKAFQQSLLDTQVMAQKDHTKWEFNVLQELIEGPLLNPKRLEEAIKGTRFIRRLMTFFHPFSHRFSNIKRERANIRWVKLGCSLMTTLMSSPDGVRYLSTEDVFLPQIVKCFDQLDPFNGVPDTDPIFAKRRVHDTLTYGYFEMLGTLSKFKDGIEVLEKFRIFTAFYHLSELKSRDDLIKGIIENLDYSIDGHPRIVLSKSLTSSYKHIRVFATQHLGALIRESATANAWTLRLLLTQLYDPAPEVSELAVHFLEEACESKEFLQLVVEMQPAMDHLGDVGHRLLMKFMSTTIGFRYLYDVGYIDRQMETWFNERNINYTIEVEVFLSKVFSSTNPHDYYDPGEFEGLVPSHFYGEMAKTELGCQVLAEKGHFTEFCQFIRQHSQEYEDADMIMKLKSILWAVGNIGATDGGLHFCEEEEIIPTILEIAESSLIPSVRGTCFFILGLISSTTQGAELLDDHEWEATLTPLSLPTGLCIPVDIEKFVTLPSWTPITPQGEDQRLMTPTSEPEIEAITAMQNLGNTVIANAASRSLARLKAKPDTRYLFSSSPDMLYRALHMISTQRYRLPVRRYIVELFSQEFDEDLLAKLNESAKRLKASPTYKPPKTDTIRMSVFGRLGKSRRGAESDESDMEDGMDITSVPEKPPMPNQRPLSLMPKVKIVGFDIA